RGPAALGTLHVYELRHLFERRATLAGNLDIERQKHRQLALGNRNHATLRAVDHRNGRAPVTLPRNTPILDAVGDRGLTEAFALGFGCHPAASFFAREAGEFAGVFHDAIVAERRFEARGIGECAIGRADYGTNRDSVL